MSWRKVAQLFRGKSASGIIKDATSGSSRAAANEKTKLKAEMSKRMGLSSETASSLKASAEGAWRGATERLNRASEASSASAEEISRALLKGRSDTFDAMKRRSDAATSAASDALSSVTAASSETVRRGASATSESLRKGSNTAASAASRVVEKGASATKEAVHRGSMAASKTLKAGSSAASESMKKAKDSVVNEVRETRDRALRWLWWWSLAAVGVYGFATTLPRELIRYSLTDETAGTDDKKGETTK